MVEREKPVSPELTGAHTAAAPSAVETARDLVALPGGSADADDGVMPLGIVPTRKRVRGRPLGATNRRTKEAADYLVEKFGDPLAASGYVAGMDLPDLCRAMRTIASDVGLKLGATVMDIARFQRECRNDVLPYVHAKRAQETETGEVVVPIVAFGRFEAAAGGGEGRSIEDVIDVTPVERN